MTYLWQYSSLNYTQPMYVVRSYIYVVCNIIPQVTFYQLDPDEVTELKTNEGIFDDIRPMPEGRLRQAIWNLFEYPDSSMTASVIAVVSVTVTMIAIMMLCIETMPYFSRNRSCDEHGRPIIAETGEIDTTSGIDPFFIVESICNVWFTMELVVRFLACPSKLGFWKDFKNAVDLASILPYYIDVLVHQGDIRCVTSVTASSSSSSPSLSYLRAIRLARVFKLTKHCIGLKVIL